MDSNTQRREFLWFMAIAFLLLAAGIGLREPWPADEPRFVLVAKQMWESGQWLFPHRGHELYPDKPPLYFWLLDAAFALVRSWRVAFLLPSLLASLATLLLTYDLGKRLWSHRAGLWAAIAVLASLQFIYQAKRAQIDPTVVFFITLGVYGILRHVLLGPQWRWFWAGWVAAGLGVITKGVGFLALLVLLPYAGMRWRRWPGLAALGSGNGWRWSGGVLAFLAAIGLWFVPMVVVALTGGDPEHHAYLQNLLFRQTATRYASAWQHTQPPWYFLTVIAAFWAPFSLTFPWLLPRWRDALKAREPRVWLPLAWALLVLLFFSASPGKRDMYILPMLPMVALAAAPYLAQVAQARGFRRVLLLFAAMLALLLLIAGAAALQSDPQFELQLESDRGLPSGDDRLWWLLVITGALSLLPLACARWWGALRAAAWSLALVVLALFCGTAVLLDDESSARALMQQARAFAAGDEIGLVAWREQNLLQATGPTTEFGFRVSQPQQLASGIEWMQQAPARRQLLVRETALDGCIDRDASVLVGRANRRSWWLVPAAAVRACDPAAIAALAAASAQPVDDDTN